MNSHRTIRKLARLVILVAMTISLGDRLSFGATLTAPEALNLYLRNTRTGCQSGEQSLDMEIQASLPKLKKEGAMQGQKVISASGQVAYRFLRFTGDKLIKTDVIARFLTAESQPPERLGNISITQANYKFRFLRETSYRGTKAYVFQLRPRKKRAGLFRGELWLAGDSATPLRETGQLVKSPSLFIQRVKFVRDYPDELGHAACGSPQRMQITVQTRLVGDAEMVIVQHPATTSWQTADDDNGR